MQLFESIDSLLSAVKIAAPLLAGVAIGDISPKDLPSYRNAGKRRRSYRQFSIPKRSGGERQITAPTGKIKAFQTCVAVFLARTYIPLDCVMGFVPDRSLCTNAACHLGKTHLLNVDLKDFFTSIGAPKVEHSLVRLGVEPLAAQWVSTLCCYPLRRADGRLLNVLPQGSPASPILSNIACEVMDARLEGLASRFGLTYTRYADDMSFSGTFKDVSVGDKLFSPEGTFFQELLRIIADNGFSLNEKKTRLAHPGDRKEVTGLTVGEKVNVPRAFTKNLRAAIHQMEHFIPDDAQLRQVSGKLAYMRMIKGKDAPTYLRLRRRFIRIGYKVKVHQRYK